MVCPFTCVDSLSCTCVYSIWPCPLMSQWWCHELRGFGSHSFLLHHILWIRSKLDFLETVGYVCVWAGRDILQSLSTLSNLVPVNKNMNSYLWVVDQVNRIFKIKVDSQHLSSTCWRIWLVTESACKHLEIKGWTAAAYSVKQRDEKTKQKHTEWSVTGYSNAGQFWKW